MSHEKITKVVTRGLKLLTLLLLLSSSGRLLFSELLPRQLGHNPAFEKFASPKRYEAVWPLLRPASQEVLLGIARLGRDGDLSPSDPQCRRNLEKLVQDRAACYPGTIEARIVREFLDAHGYLPEDNSGQREQLEKLSSLCWYVLAASAGVCILLFALMFGSKGTGVAFIALACLPAFYCFCAVQTNAPRFLPKEQPTIREFRTVYLQYARGYVGQALSGNSEDSTFSFDREQAAYDSCLSMISKNDRRFRAQVDAKLTELYRDKLGEDQYQQAAAADRKESLLVYLNIGVIVGAFLLFKLSQRIVSLAFD